MQISLRDRRLMQALLQAEKNVRHVDITSPRTQGVVDLVVALLCEARQSMEHAVQAEDEEDAEAHRAGVHRQRAFDELREAFARLYAGLNAGVSLAVLRGVQTDEVADLRSFVSHATPSVMAAASFGHVIQTVRTAQPFIDKFIPEPERALTRAFVAEALRKADEANRDAMREQAEAIGARTVLFRAREEARRHYLAARDLMSGALRLEGHEDRLHVILPPFERFRRRGRRRPEGEDGEEGFDEDDLAEAIDLEDLPDPV